MRESKTLSMMLIGDCITYSLRRYPHIWKKYYGNLAVNCRIAVDKVKKILCRVENLTLPSSVDYTVIKCGTKNIEYNKASGIANGLLCVAMIMVSKSVKQEETKSKK